MTEIEKFPVARSRKPPRFKLTQFDELKPTTEAACLVRGLLPRVGLAVVWGPPKCGKSFLTFDLMMHVALGWAYRGRRVKGGPVVYCAFEGADGFKARAEAFRRRHSVQAGAPFYLIAARINMARDHADLIASIREQAGDDTPAAVVLDTLNRSLAGSESSDEDMTAYVLAADALRAAFNCAVVIVHHCGIDGSRPRGHTSLTGAVDAQIAVKRDEAGTIEATVEYMKDGPEGDQICSRLEPVTVGTDEDGEPITSCIVTETDASTTPKHQRNPMPKSAARALRALSETILERGEPAPASSQIPHDAKVVTMDSWRTQAYARGISTSEKLRSRQAAFQRGTEYLIDHQAVGVWGDYVWIAKKDTPK